MARAFLFILDSFGIGGAPDAEAFGDVGANTLGNIAKACFENKANKSGIRQGNLKLPNLEALGLGYAAKNATGVLPHGFIPNSPLKGVWANAMEVSTGKDTPSGHWEIAGVPVLTDWGYFKEKENSFPKELLSKVLDGFELDGSLANKHASGTEVIKAFGVEHIKTGQPIFYTSADSVMQIAAHEKYFGLDRLYELCELAFKYTKEINIGRVIARPFVGETSKDFQRTGNRKDFSIKPPQDTILDIAKTAGRQVVAIGKIADIYAHCGPTKTVKANGNESLGKATLGEIPLLPEGGLLITNFVDFDMLYGHRRDVVGYANALEAFDLSLPKMLQQLKEDDLLILTADHGCDPTWHGTEHTREQVPVLCFGPNLAAGEIGTLTSFADIGATLAKHINITMPTAGKPFTLEFTHAAKG